MDSFIYYQFLLLLLISRILLSFLMLTHSYFHLINLLSFWISGENFFHCEDVKLISLNFEYLGWSLSFKSSNFKRPTWLSWLTMNRLAANIEQIVVDNDHFLLHVIGVYFPWIWWFLQLYLKYLKTFSKCLLLSSATCLVILY